MDEVTYKRGKFVARDFSIERLNDGFGEMVTHFFLVEIG